MDIGSPDELWKLLPEMPEFPAEMTAAEFAARTGLNTDIGRMALKVFCRCGLAEEIGKRGRARVYALPGSEKYSRETEYGGNRTD